MDFAASFLRGFEKRSSGSRTYAKEKASARFGDRFVKTIHGVGLGAGALGLGAAGGYGLYRLLKKKKAK